MPVVKSLPRMGLGLSSKVLVLTSSVASLVLVSSQSMTKFNSLCSVKLLRVDLVKMLPARWYWDIETGFEC